MNIPEKIDLNILDDQINTIKVLMLGNKINDLISYLKSKEEGEFNEGCKECQKTTDGRACNFHTKKFYKNVFGTSVLPDTPDKEEKINLKTQGAITAPDKMEWERDREFFNALENVLDEYFPKIHEETPEKIANKRAEALMLFTEANHLHSKLMFAHLQKHKEEMMEIIQKLPLTQILTTKGEVEKSLIDKDVLLTELNK